MRILTLGQFATSRDGAAALPASVGSKPFALLALVIGNGGAQAPADYAMGMLWPELPAPAARASLLAAVRKLRRRLGQDGAVTMAAGRIGLSPAHCWVDAVAFEELVGIADVLPDDSGRAAFGAVATQALALYRGHFLPGEEESAIVVDYRERLRSRYTRLANRAGRHWLREGEPERAIQVYRHALALDPGAADTSRHLMLALIALGRPMEALSTYTNSQARP